MIKKAMTLGLALVAVAALSGVATASAAEFHSEIETTYLFGEQEGENTFTTPNGNVKCKKATFTQDNVAGIKVSAGTFKTATLEITPAYTECTAFGQAATVDVNGCKYQITAQSTTAGTVEKINCPTAPIEVTVPTAACDVTIGTQVPTAEFDKLTFEAKNAGTSSASVKVTSGVSKLTYTVDSTSEPPKKTGESTTCGTVGEHKEEATYDGSVNIKGYTGVTHATQVGILVS